MIVTFAKLVRFVAEFQIAKLGRIIKDIGRSLCGRNRINRMKTCRLQIDGDEFEIFEC